ncbi:transcriptional regulator, TetR family [Streptococcus henryi]|uniref:Transcriptional regulator, TetR family n=1 Tax=Streptococcus henryi TaxID=439219 RepID=A0A1G6A5S9_9STRE|nr:TetR/AcrR family transcriptional regulator [Streptococcus henryi]SDB03811.1 transcriptional regulator, TetR family [Streptococcus henryi]
MDSRELCLEQTLLILSERGLKFTMSELASQLGMSKKTIYQLFVSKEALLSEVVKNTFAKIKEEEQIILSDESLDIIQKIKALTIVLPDSYKSLNWQRVGELADKYPKIYAQIQEGLELDWESTLSLYEEAIERGLIKPTNLAVVKTMIEASIEHFLSTHDLEEGQISYIEALETMMDIILYGITTDGNATNGGK